MVLLSGIIITQSLLLFLVKVTFPNLESQRMFSIWVIFQHFKRSYSRLTNSRRYKSVKSYEAFVSQVPHIRLTTEARQGLKTILLAWDKFCTIELLR